MFSGVSTSSLFLREMNEDALTVLNALGVRSTEIFLTTFSEYTEEFARLLLSRRGELKVNSVHLLNTQFEPQLFGSHPRAKKDAFEILHRAMASAHIFGAERYTFHSLTRLKRNSSPLNYDSLGENFNEIIAACAEHGVKLCLENVHWALYNEPGIFSRLKRRCPDLQGVLDVKQARLSGYPYQMYVKDMEFDFEECLRRLKDAGFDGALLIEVYPKDYGDYAELKRSCDYLDEIIEKIG